jgi:hypothetical protein
VKSHLARRGRWKLVLQGKIPDPANPVVCQVLLLLFEILVVCWLSSEPTRHSRADGLLHPNTWQLPLPNISQNVARHRSFAPHGAFNTPLHTHTARDTHPLQAL